MVLVLFLLGTGVFSMPTHSRRALQLPRLGSRAAVLITRRAAVFCRNCFKLGLLLAPPRWRCLLKKRSNGSWHRRSLKTHFTPGCLKRNSRSPVKEWTVLIEGTIINTVYYNKYLHICVPVIIKPCCVSLERHIMVFSATENPFLSATLFFHFRR